jgi:hypothetical protein
MGEGGGIVPLVLVTPKSTSTQLKSTKGTSMKAVMNMHTSARNPNRKNAHKGGSGPLISKDYSYTIETGQPHYVINVKDTPTMETPQQSTLPNSQTSTYLSEASLAKHLALLESELDLTTPEGHSFLISQGYSKKNNQEIWYSKTSKVYLVITAAGLSRQSLGFSPTWGILWNGRYLTAKTSEFPKTESVSSLSDILEENPDEKYFLSQEIANKLLVSLDTSVKKSGHADTNK